MIFIERTPSLWCNVREGGAFFEFFLTGVIGNERMSEEDKKREVETANAFTIHWRTQALLNDATFSPHKVVSAGRSPRGEKYFFSLKKSFPEKMTFYFAPGLRPTGAKPCINK